MENLNFSQVMGTDIIRLCLLVNEINELAADMRRYRELYFNRYNGKETFEQMYKEQLEYLQSKQDELKALLQSLK